MFEIIAHTRAWNEVFLKEQGDVRHYHLELRSPGEKNSCILKVARHFQSQPKAVQKRFKEISKDAFETVSLAIDFMNAMRSLRHVRIEAYLMLRRTRASSRTSTNAFVEKAAAS